MTAPFEYVAADIPPGLTIRAWRREHRAATRISFRVRLARLHGAGAWRRRRRHPFG